MLKFCAKTDIGRKRAINQDCVYASGNPVGNLANLFVVADGMGGHKAGDYASNYTVQVIEREASLSEFSEPVLIMRNAITEANREVYEKASTEADYQGMGTTTVAATIVGDVMYVANVGDSRLYIIDNEITQVTRDHSLVAEMVRVGSLKESEARVHPDKNIITRAIGAARSVNIDFFEVELKKGDHILMCSDGLTNMVEDEQILQIVNSQQEPADIVAELIKMANQNGGKDNIGVVIVEPFADEVR